MMIYLDLFRIIDLFLTVLLRLYVESYEARLYKCQRDSGNLGKALQTMLW